MTRRRDTRRTPIDRRAAYRRALAVLAASDYRPRLSGAPHALGVAVGVAVRQSGARVHTTTRDAARARLAAAERTHADAVAELRAAERAGAPVWPLVGRVRRAAEHVARAAAELAESTPSDAGTALAAATLAEHTHTPIPAPTATPGAPTPTPRGRAPPDTHTLAERATPSVARLLACPDPGRVALGVSCDAHHARHARDSDTPCERTLCRRDVRHIVSSRRVTGAELARTAPASSARVWAFLTPATGNGHLFGEGALTSRVRRFRTPHPRSAAGRTGAKSCLITNRPKNPIFWGNFCIPISHS
jgi:hypothetical protein